MQRLRRGFPRAEGAFVAASLLLQGAKLAFAFAAARVLAPSEFAVWNQALLVVQYSTYAQLGVTTGVNRDVSVLVGAAREGAARRRGGAALAVVVLTVTAFSTVVVQGLDVDGLGRRVAFAAFPVLTALVLFSQTLARAWHTFGTVTRALTIEAVGWLLVAGPVLVLSDSLAFVAVVDGILLVVLLTFVVHRRGWIRLRFGLSDLRGAIGSGLTLGAAGATFTLRQTADLLLALRLFDAHLFAGLMVSTIFVRGLALIPTLTAQLWLPALGATYGRGGIEALNERARRIAARYLPLVVPAVILVSGAAYVACSTVLDTYEEYRTLVVVKVAAEGSTLLVTVAVMYLSTIRRSRVIVLANALALLPYAWLMLGAATRTDLTASIAASAVLYVTTVAVGYRRLARGTKALAA